MTILYSHKEPLSKYSPFSYWVSQKLPISSTSNGSENFSLLISLDAIKFVLLSFFIHVETIQLKIRAKQLLRNVKRPLPVDLHGSKTPLLTFPNENHEPASKLSKVRQNEPRENARPSRVTSHDSPKWRACSQAWDLLPPYWKARRS